MSALLQTTDLTVSFGGLKANDSINIAIDEGKLVGLIGPNGAGKTTMIDALTGFVPCSGKIEFDGDDITGLVAHDRARRGLGRTWQSLELFDDLTIEENLMVAAQRQSIGSFFMDLIRPRRPLDRSNVDFAIEVLGLGDLAHRMPTEISQGQRKLVSAARALAGRPKLLLMDEPAAGLDNAESAELGADMKKIIDAGVSIFLIDHDMSLVFEVCDYVYVIEFGKLIAQGTPAEVRTHPDVIEAYLGASHKPEEVEAAMEAVNTRDPVATEAIVKTPSRSALPDEPKPAKQKRGKAATADEAADVDPADVDPADVDPSDVDPAEVDRKES